MKLGFMRASITNYYKTNESRNLLNFVDVWVFIASIKSIAFGIVTQIT